MGIYERLFGGGSEVETEDAFMGYTAETAAQEAEKLAVDVPEISWKDVGNVALDFTPIIGDIKGGYDTVKLIGEELDKENPNYYLIGAMGGLGAVGTILGLVPGAGDAAQKAIMQGTKMMAEKSGQLAGDVTGIARAVKDGDIEFLRSYRDPSTTQGVGADVVKKPVNKATVAELDPTTMRDGTKRQGYYENKPPNYIEDIEVQTRDTGELIPEKPLVIDDLQDTTLIPLPADRSDTGKELLGIKGGARDYTFTNPIYLGGGDGFMRDPYTGAFASMPNVVKEQTDLAKKIADEGGDPRVIFTAMGPQGVDFNDMMTSTAMDMIRQDLPNIKKADVDQLDSWIRTNIDRDFPGISDSGAEQYLIDNVPGTRRRLIWQELNRGEYTKKGFPNMGDARVGITKPSLLTTPSLEGTSVAKISTQGSELYGPVKQHKTYSAQFGPTGAEGYVGTLGALPYEILHRDFFEARRLQGKPLGSDQRALTMGKFGTNVDQQMVDEANEYTNLIDQAERDEYRRNISQMRQDRTQYKFGDNGGPPLNDPPVENQMTVAFAEPLEIGINPAAAEGAFLKPYTNEDVQMLEQLVEGATAGTRKADELINSPVEAGTKVGIRLNLNSNIPDAPQGMNKLQTLHKNNYNGTALSYLPTATVENVKFNVSQSGRAGIAAKKYAPDTPEAKNKFPAMSVDGNYVPDRNVLNEMDDTVVQIGTNPMNLHLFVDMATGQAVESAEIATVIGDRAFAKGVTYMKQSDAPKPKDASDGTPLPSDVRYKFNQGGFATAVGY